MVFHQVAAGIRNNSKVINNLNRKLLAGGILSFPKQRPSDSGLTNRYPVGSPLPHLFPFFLFLISYYGSISLGQNPVGERVGNHHEAYCLGNSVCH